MAVWITFATEDNADGDIDYLAQEVAKTGLRTRMHPMFPGEDAKIERLTTAFLGRSEQTEAWIFYSSANSMRDQRPEMLGRALEQARAIRGSFPAVSFRAGSAGLESTTAIDICHGSWRESLAFEIGSGTPQEGGRLPPYVARMHPDLVLELRPKFGTWEPFLFAVRPEEKDRVSHSLTRASRGRVPVLSASPAEEGFSEDAEWYYLRGREAATPLLSYYVQLGEIPSWLIFGQEHSEEMFVLGQSDRNK